MEGESKGGYFPSWHTTFAESLVSNPKFAAMMQEKINMKVDTAAIDQEIANYEKQLRQSYSIKSKLMEEIDSLDPDDRHYIKRKADLDDRLYKMYDRIEEIESQLITARAKKQAIEAEKLTGDNIYKVLTGSRYPTLAKLQDSGDPGTCCREAWSLLGGKKCLLVLGWPEPFACPVQWV